MALWRPVSVWTSTSTVGLPRSNKPISVSYFNRNVQWFYHRKHGNLSLKKVGTIATYHESRRQSEREFW